MPLPFRLPPFAQPTFDPTRFDPNLDPDRFPPQQTDYDPTAAPPDQSQPVSSGQYPSAMPRAADLGTAPPIPPKRRTALEEFDALQASRPGPATGVRGHALDFVGGGLPGLAAGFLDKNRDARERYQEQLRMLPLRQRIEHQQALEKETEANTALRGEQIADVRAQRKTTAEDRDLDRDAKIAQAGLEEVQPGELEPTGPAGGKFPAYSQVRIGEKTYRRPTRYQLGAEAQAAKESSYEQVPDIVARSVGMPVGTKLPPDRVVALYQLYEAHNKNQERTPEAQIEFRKKVIGLTGLSGRDAQVYLATGNIERPPAVNVSLLNRQDQQQSEDGLAKDLASGKLTRLRDVTSMRGGERQRLYAKILAINPSFNTSEIDRKIAFLDKYTNKEEAKNLRSYDIFLQHAADAVDAVDASKNLGVQVLNRPMNELKRALGSSPEYQRLQVSLEPAAKEWMSFLLNNHALYEDDRKVLQGIIDGNMSPANAKASLRAMAHTAAARVTAENNRFRRIMGQDLPEDIVSPEAHAAAQKLGVNLFGSRQEAQQPTAAALPDKPANGYTRMRAPAPSTQVMDKPNNEVDYWLKLGATKVK